MNPRNILVVAVLLLMFVIVYRHDIRVIRREVYSQGIEEMRGSPLCDQLKEEETQ